MAADRNRPIAESAAVEGPVDTPIIHVSGEPDGRLPAFLIIGGRRAEVHLPDWIEPSPDDQHSAARTALQRALLSFQEGVTPHP